MSTNDRIDIDALKRAMPLEKLVAQYGVELARNGNEYRALCPFHDEQSPSFTVTADTDTYYCFGCGAGGDHVKFIQQWHGEDFLPAAKRLAALAGGSVVDTGAAQQREAPTRQSTPATTWIKSRAPGNVPPPSELPQKIDGEWVRHTVVAAWPYRDAEGNLAGYACRVHTGVNDDGTPKKDVIPVTWQTNTETGEERWKQGALEVPRLLYGTDLLAQNPDAPVIIVEGEKTADAARIMLAGVSPAVVVTWPGGGKGVTRADWSLLRGRVVIAVPDVDRQVVTRGPREGEFLPYTQQPGMAAMLKIASLAAENGFRMRVVAVPRPDDEVAATMVDGWDLADAHDEGWTGQHVMTWIRENAVAPADIRDERPETATPSDDAPARQETQMKAPTERADPFRILGWFRNTAFYMPADSQQVVPLSPAAHTSLNLMSLAPLAFWESRFLDETASSKKPKIEWQMAADSLMRRAKAMRPFNQDMVRGRGVWREDDGRVAVHLGDRVVIDGVVYNLADAPSDYVYEAGHSVRMAIGDPLGDAESIKLARICEAIRWERAMYGTLLAGWVFLAPICGALGWRPSIWVTGSAGSGKTTVMKDVVDRCVRKSGHFLVGDSSEAGVRQTLGRDAMPIIFDEFESERRKAQERTEDVLALVTASSSESGAKLAKGGAGGQADIYRIRSMFAFSSISVSIRQAAAVSRISVLSLKTPIPGQRSEADNEQYQALQRSIQDTLTSDYIDRLQARAVSMIEDILYNAEIFTRAASIVLGSRRSGEQIGTLIAGAYALHKRGKVSLEYAQDWIARRDWSDEKEDAEDSDERMCLQHIMGWPLRITIGDRGTDERSVGELVAKLAGISSDPMVSRDEAQSALGRTGIRVDGDHIIIANKHRALERVLDGKPWAPPAHARVLGRLKGAVKSGSEGTPSTYKFGGVNSRAVLIPIEHVT